MGGSRIAILVAATLGGGGILIVPASSEGATASYVATAVAEGGRATLTFPGFAAVEEVLDGGAPVAQAYADPVSVASFASLPYPGETAIVFPGLFSAVTGQPPPPGYPFYVAASHPATPEEELADPTGWYRLAARADARGADALARWRTSGSDEQPAAGGSESIADVTVTDDGITVTAQTVNEALEFGDGALRIASVRSRSVTTKASGEVEPDTVTELVVEGGSAAGYSFAFGPQGFVVANQGIPLPVGSGLDQLNSVLEPAGITLRFGAAEPRPGGAMAGTFDVLLTFPGNDGLPPTVLQLRFGGATTSIDTGADLGIGLPDTSIDVPGQPTPVTEHPVAAEPPGADQPAPARPGAGDRRGDIGIPIRAPDPPAPGAMGGDAVVPSAAAPVTGDGPTLPAFHPRLGFEPRDDGPSGVAYSVLVAAGFVFLTVSSLWRWKGGSTL